MREPIRVFIGVDGPRAVAIEVLKYSILRNTKSEVHFFHLEDMKFDGIFKKNGMSKEDVKNLMYTGFSFYRWAIPMLCDYKGRAIYLDADIINFHDINDLWSMDMKGKSHVLNKNYSSVMLIDCEKAKWDFAHMCKGALEDKTTYKNYMWCKGGLCTSENKGSIDPSWNHLDKWDETTKMLHYTKVPTQPWDFLDHKHGDKFYELLDECLEYGFISEEELDNAIQKGVCNSKIKSKLKKTKLKEEPSPQKQTESKSRFDIGALNLLNRAFNFKSILVTGTEKDEISKNLEGKEATYLSIHRAETEPISDSAEFDLGWCVDTVEKVSEDKLGNLLVDLVKCSVVYMTYSADPNIEGNVNANAEEYWIQIMSQFGFEFNPKLTKKVRFKSREPHIKETGLIFTRRF